MFSIVNDSVTVRVYPNILYDDSDDSVQQKSYKPDELQLPWNEKHWNVYLTSVSSTVEVWGRLIGPEYSVTIRNASHSRVINKQSNRMHILYFIFTDQIGLDSR